MALKIKARLRRRQRIRKKVAGDGTRPRLSVSRSLKHLYAQLIDDQKAITLLGLSTLCKEQKKGGGGNLKQAHAFGLLFAKKAQGLKISKEARFKVVFDRGGCQYHGRVKAFADGAREGGLVF